MEITDPLRRALRAEIRRTSIRAVARRLGVSPRAIPTYLGDIGRPRLAADIERRAAELGWPPSDDDGDDA